MSTNESSGCGEPYIQVLPIYAELREERAGAAPGARRRTMERVVLATVGLCFLGYSLVGEFAYLHHPDVVGRCKLDPSAWSVSSTL